MGLLKTPESNIGEDRCEMEIWKAESFSVPTSAEGR